MPFGNYKFIKRFLMHKMLPMDHVAQKHSASWQNIIFTEHRHWKHFEND